MTCKFSYTVLEFKYCEIRVILNDLRLNGLGHTSDLVDLQQQTVTGLHINSLLDSLWICDQ